MAIAIDTIAMDTFQGRMPYAQVLKGVIPGDVGVKGAGVLKGAKKVATATIPTSVKVAGDITAAHAVAAACRALADADTITVVDQFGNTWTGVVVVAVTALPSLTAVTNVSQVDCLWIFEVPVDGMASGASAQVV